MLMPFMPYQSVPIANSATSWPKVAACTFDAFSALMIFAVVARDLLSWEMYVLLPNEMNCGCQSIYNGSYYCSDASERECAPHWDCMRITRGTVFSICETK